MNDKNLTGSNAIEECFIKASVIQFIKTRHPYDFIETYDVLRQVFSYQTYYVNLGYWRDGFETQEAGRLLADEVVSCLNLGPEDLVLDVGSGLGQTAVDACTVHGVQRVVGLNVNHRQVRFANLLAAREGLSDKVLHVTGDACKDLEQFESHGFTCIMALECANHFSSPDFFFKSARKVLGTGGRISLSVNVSARNPSLRQQWLTRAAFGFSPVPLDMWIRRLSDAGFTNIETRNISGYVLKRGLRFAVQRLERTKCLRNWTPLQRMYLKLQLTTALQSAESGVLEYYIVSAEA